MPHRLEFWFEFASTYSYLAASRIVDLATAAGVTLAWKPFLLGPIFRAQGWNDSPFNIYETKGRYMWRDMERSCEKYGLPWRRPTQFPRNGLMAARAACVAAEEAWCPAFVRGVYHANFVDDHDIGDARVVGAILEKLDQSASAWLERAQSGESKERLRQQTDAAMQRGIFGAPSFVVRDQLFWGNDRLEDALGWARRRT